MVVPLEPSARGCPRDSETAPPQHPIQRPADRPQEGQRRSVTLVSARLTDTEKRLFEVGPPYRGRGKVRRVLASLKAAEHPQRRHC